MIYQNLIVIFCYMIKSESIQMRRKRIECNNHGNPIKYRCETENCNSPYLCGEEECINEHFHKDGKVVLSRFDSKLWESKFQEVENVLNNETLKVKEEYLTKLVDYFAQSLRKIHQDMSRYQQVKEKICEQEAVNANPQYFDNINGFLSLSNKLERKLDHLRAKIIDEDIAFEDSPINIVPSHIEINESNPSVERESQVDRIKNKFEIEKIANSRENEEQNQENGVEEEPELVKLPQRKNYEYYENPYLAALLKKYIKKFEWSLAEVIFSSQSQLTTCERFHEKLKDRRNLLFLFIGEREIIGSYYTEPYPSVSQRVRKDANSFIFILDEEIEEKFAIFFAENHVEAHMTVSEKLLICQGNTPNNGDGLRTFQRNFESLAYFLPSISFNNPNSSREVTYNGVLKIKQFYILQLSNV